MRWLQRTLWIKIVRVSSSICSQWHNEGGLGESGKKQSKCETSDSKARTEKSLNVESLSWCQRKMDWTKRCISRIFKTIDNMLTKLRKDKRNSLCHRVLPARMVINSLDLLSKMACPDNILLSEWDTVTKRQASINQTCRMLSSIIYLIVLSSNSTIPTVHGNSFKKHKQKLTQYNFFKSFFQCNSIPTGRGKSRKTHYLIPTIRKIRASPAIQLIASIGSE